MKSFGSAILLSAVGAFCANGIAFGQAPSQKLGAGEPISDQERIATEPVVARVARDASTLPRPHPGQSNPLRAIPLESLHETRDRPLFSATRRQPPPVVAETPKVKEPASAPQPSAPEKPQVTLIGVVHGPGLDLAVLVDETHRSLARLRLGQTIHGWTMHSLGERTATLEKAEQQVKLELPARNDETAARATTPADVTAAALALDQ
jgi:general secretion pathway protein N